MLYDHFRCRCGCDVGRHWVRSLQLVSPRSTGVMLLLGVTRTEVAPVMSEDAFGILVIRMSSWSASATLGPGHCRRLCRRAAIRPGGHRTLAEHLLPGAGTASCVREKLSLFPSRVSTLASGREILGVKRRMLDSSPLWGVPDTARIAPGERGGQIHDPGVKLGRSGNSSVDYAFARLHLFVERLRHGKEIYMPSTTGSVFHLSIPDPRQNCKSRMSPYVSNISTQTKDPSTPRRNAEC